jgi:DNA-binding response OmpR family regulator
MERPCRVLSRQQIIDLAGGDRYVHINRLRAALGGDGKPDIIRTARGLGNALDDQT